MGPPHRQRLPPHHPPLTAPLPEFHVQVTTGYGGEIHSTILEIDVPSFRTEDAKKKNKRTDDNYKKASDNYPTTTTTPTTTTP